MDELDRLFQCVVRAVRDAQPEYLSKAFEVGDLLAYVPYRTVRAEVGVETNDDFAHAVTRLLAGERGYVFADDLMQDDLKAELASPNPDLGTYRTYANAHVTLSQEHARIVLETIGPAAAGAAASTGPAAPDATAHAGAAPAPAPPAAATTSSAAAPPEAASAPPRISSPGTPRPAAPRTAPARRAPALSPRPIDPDTVTAHRPSRPGCRYCGQQLPDARDLNFCPSCGQDLRARRCAACSAELEAGWKFCVACGRAAAP